MSTLQSSCSLPSCFLTPKQNLTRAQLNSLTNASSSTPNGAVSGVISDTAPVCDPSTSLPNNNNQPRTSVDHNGNANAISALNRRFRHRPRGLTLSTAEGIPPRIFKPVPLVPLVCQYPSRGLLSFIPQGPYFVSFFSKKPKSEFYAFIIKTFGTKNERLEILFVFVFP